MESSARLGSATIPYRDDGAGQPVVFVHGALVDGRLWRLVTPLLAGSRRCIVPDLPLGSHREPLAAGADRSPRGIARLLGEFVHSLDAGPVTLVGNDTGGALCQMLASERPELVRALVLTNCDCLENFPPPAIAPLKWLTYVPGAYALVAEAMRSARLRRSPAGFGLLCRTPFPDELSAEWLAPMRRAEIRSDLYALFRGFDSRETLSAAQELGAHPLPLLLAWSPDDPFFKVDFARRLAAMIAGARLELVPGSRAFVPQDQPGRLAELIDDFLDSLTEAGTEATSSRGAA